MNSSERFSNQADASSNAASIPTPLTQAPQDTPVTAASADTPAPAKSQTAVGNSDDASAKDWWNDPTLPWRHKPGRSDWACMAWIAAAGFLALAMIPLRAWLLGSPDRLPWLVALLGSHSGTTGLGAVIRTDNNLPVVWPLLVGSFMSVKLDWIYWWAGKLWGHGIIEVWAGQSKRTAKTYAHAERWAQKLGWFGIFVAYVPIPLPIMTVVFVLTGASGMSWKKFIILDYFASLIWLLGYLAFGYLVGEPARQILTWYSNIANYVAIILVIVIIVGAFWKARK